MTDTLRIALCLCGISALGVMDAHAQTDLQIASLSLARADEEALRFTDTTRVDLRISMPGKRIMGLADAARITSLRDDAGSVLIGEGAQTAAEAAQAAEAKWGMGVASSLQGSIRRDAVSIGPDANYIIVPAVAPLLPSATASRLELTATLMVNVAGDGERTVTLSNVDLDDDWGTRLEVDGQPVRCSLDESSGEGAERVSRFYCYGDGVDLMRIRSRGSESVAIADATGRPNLAVTGSLSDVDLEFVLPKAEPVEVPVELSFGVGL